MNANPRSRIIDRVHNFEVLAINIHLAHMSGKESPEIINLIWLSLITVHRLKYNNQLRVISWHKDSSWRAQREEAGAITAPLTIVSQAGWFSCGMIVYIQLSQNETTTSDVYSSPHLTSPHTKIQLMVCIGIIFFYFQRFTHNYILS